jgi:hypothetical protein
MSATESVCDLGKRGFAGAEFAQVACPALRASMTSHELSTVCEVPDQ